MLKKGFLALVFCSFYTASFALATGCQFQYAYGGAMLDDLYNGPIICRDATLETLAVEGAAKLTDTHITKQLNIRGDLDLYHTQLAAAKVYGTVEGKDCKIDGVLTLYGNRATFENCELNNVDVYDDHISAFPPTITLIKTKVRGKIHFHERKGRVISHESVTVIQ